MRKVLSDLLDGAAVTSAGIAAVVIYFGIPIVWLIHLIDDHYSIASVMIFGIGGMMVYVGATVYAFFELADRKGWDIPSMMPFATPPAPPPPPPFPPCRDYGDETK